MNAERYINTVTVELFFSLYNLKLKKPITNSGHFKMLDFQKKHTLSQLKKVLE